MKKIMSMVLCVALLLTFGVFALASTDDGESNVDNQGGGSVDATQSQSNLGDYQVEILSCRLAKTWDDKPGVIVKYKFTNNADNPISFVAAFDCEVYQSGVGLNEAYMMADSAEYSLDNQSKDIKKGASFEVEVAYELNDEVTDIEVEVKELFSFSDKTVTKTFSIAQ